MKKIILVLLAGIASLSLNGISLAEPKGTPGLQKRELNQQKRIQQGAQSGQLTPAETARLEAQQAKIKQDEERMKADGKLTKAERRKLQQERNQASKNIYRKKHNSQKVNVGQ